MDKHNCTRKVEQFRMFMTDDEVCKKIGISKPTLYKRLRDLRNRKLEVMKNIIGYLAYLIWGNKKCLHMFRSSEVVNLNIDPKCIYCNTPLSNCGKGKKGMI